MTTTQKILLTGTGGFILGNFVRKLAYEKKPYEIISIDRVSDSSVLETIYRNKNHQFYIGNVCDEHSIDVIFKFYKPDIIIHNAIENFDNNQYIKNNVIGTEVITKAAIKHQVKKIIFLSTNKVYGEIEDTNIFPNEIFLTNPLTYFAQTQLMSENIIKTLTKNTKTNYNIIRLGNIYGTRQNIKKLVPAIFNSIIKEEKIPVFGKGLKYPYTRDFCYMNDLISAMNLILEKGEDNQIYNVSGNEFTNVEIVQLICNIMGKGHSNIEFLENNNEGIRYCGNSDKIKSLGWINKTKIKDGLTETIEWLNNNKYIFERKEK